MSKLSNAQRLAALSGGVLSVLAPVAFARADVSPHAGMLRYPDVSSSHIVFAYANDLWIVPKAGGMAAPLASPPGPEAFPRFSPDGKTIAFVGNYEGNRDLYTISITGGVPNRVTHHPGGELLCDWTQDGKSLIFLTNGQAGLARQTQIFTVAAGGGLPSKLPVPYSGFGSISPDGTWLAYTPHSTDTRTWKRYRGGMATDVWLFNLKDMSAKKITDWEGTDTLPMWVPGGDSSVVYYLSDAGPEHRLNIWSYDVKSSKREQVTSFKDDDVRWPSAGPGAGKGEVVFQLGAKLMLLDLATRKAAEVNVSIPGDRPKLKTRMVDASRLVAGAAISPSGKRVVVEARGDLWSAPVKEGVVRPLTRTDGVAERDPSWSPDNKWIAYFSDETGEYELWIRPTDARPPEEKKEEKKDGEKKDADTKPADGQPAAAAKPEEKKPDEKPEPKREPRKLTTLGPGFRYNPNWSPDSKHIAFTDAGGRLFITEVESGATKELDKDPYMTPVSVSWSSDSQWVTYSRSDDGNTQGCIWIANVKTGDKKQITSNMFTSGSPTFDRKGDWLFFTSNRAINNPTYSDIDNSFAYTSTDTVLMVPLRKDVKSPWLPKSDEEELKKDEKKKDEAKKDDAKKEEAKKDEGKKDESKGEAKPAAPAQADDGVSGTYSGSAKGGPQGAEIPFTLVIKVAPDGTFTGTMSSIMGSGAFSGTYDKASGALTGTVALGGNSATITGTIKNGEFTGNWSAGNASGEMTAKRTSSDTGSSGDGKEAKKDGGDKDKPKEVKIDFEGMERRAITLPIGSGNFGGLSVADGEKLIYVRAGSRGEGAQPGIKIFDYKSAEPKEEAVTAGGGYQLSADGKKLLVFRGNQLSIQDAAAGGGKAQTVPTAGNMPKTIDPRAEWKQIFTDAWRLQRDFFYEPTMHGVNWANIRTHYGAMVEDAASREDVNWIISEMISELNIGHAYLGAPGDTEDQPAVNVGLLGCDFSLDKGDAGAAYKITRIYEGAPWDADARGPLSQPGVDVKEGEYILAVNGVPIDPSKDPWASFVGTADKTIALTVNASPAMDGKEREVLVKPIGSEVNLRYRAWIEHNRAYVEEKSGGKIGYIYVPNTGVDGQSDLFRQFYGQRQMAALVIDERWNGGGQIPTRFIELMNRPVTNYWARRDGKDWTWPPDSHQGPKAMLVNGLAGSGGDMFPWLFKYNKIGKVIGTRTWGGLVGISGNPGLIDGGSITVPTFGFYEKDGTWGVEGHGTDPDMVVIDDPSQMVKGGDPQLDAAIAHLLDEIAKNPYLPPKRPASPDRSGMGVKEQDK
ncbi:MAG: PD40 domain-containing protein [Phycisphaerae bacterium]|nr:PD40 domain-containing protein [Phycisphaerae bacterium]